MPKIIYPYGTSSSSGGSQPRTERVKLGILGATAEGSVDEVRAVNAEAGRNIDFMSAFHGFPASPAYLYYSQDTQTMTETGVTYIIANGPAAPLHTYTDGSQDSVIDAIASDAKNDGRTVIMRLAHEMNGNWNAWGFTKETPAQFIAGWQYFVDRIRAQGADNIRFCWNPNVWDGSIPTVIDDYENWFPGDDYVDYIAADGYMNLLESVKTFEDIFLASYTRMMAMSTRPFMIGETGVATDARVDKPGWIRDMFTTIRDKMPRCVALNYWNRDSTGAGEGDYRFDQVTADLNAFKLGVANQPFVDIEPSIEVVSRNWHPTWNTRAWKPTGALEENYPRMLGQANGLAATSGRLFVFMGPRLKGGVTYHHITLVSGNPGGSGTTHQWFALLDQSLKVPRGNERRREQLGIVCSEDAQSSIGL